VSHEITAVHMSATGNEHEHIVEVQWRNATNGGTGNSTRSAMVRFINEKNDVFVSAGSRRVAVGVVNPSRGHAYIRTHADGSWTNNLLSLPRY